MSAATLAGVERASSAYARAVTIPGYHPTPNAMHRGRIVMESKLRVSTVGIESDDN